MDGGQIDFRFDYPGGAFRTAFTPEGDGTWVIRQWRETDAGWSEFGVKHLPCHPG
ncbi:MAG: hypothetical protein R3343_14085 [Nitriliruptorales bacterium]|nr:hypothetical protein [Nitriliruptorales bacterium]